MTQRGQKPRTMKEQQRMHTTTKTGVDRHKTSPVLERRRKGVPHVAHVEQEIN